MSASIESKIKQKEAELFNMKNALKAKATMTTSEKQEMTDLADVRGARKSKVDQLIEAMEEARGKRLLICIKGYPDPDNIATSLALGYIASRFDIQFTIVHFDQISHHENRALVKKLDLEIEEYSDQFDYSSYDYFAINDAQNTDLPIKLPDTCKLLVFVDHHKKLGTVTGRFIDIRETVGSTSAIYGEYLRDPRFGFSGQTSEESKIATALMHGVRSDTDNFVNATPLDYLASEFLTRFVDKDLLSLISRQSIPAKTMDLTQIALQRKDIRGTFMFSGVGYVREEDRDGIGQCADYLLHREGIDTVIVYGVVGGAMIDGSLRTKSHTLDPDKWLKDVFGQDPHGNYYGGGRKDKGGFQIPLGVFAQCSDRELLWILIKKTIDELFYNKIGIENGESIGQD
ncbi:MAG: bifunctional oligoribonuclease/PAP phosphatase NrnA [Oligoflexales bacterium]